MTRRLRLVLLVLLLASFLDLAPAAPARADSSPKPRLATAYELIDAVNRYRGQNGLPAYSTSSILMGTAQNQAAYMASIGSWTHTGPGGTSYRDRLTAVGYSAVFASENVLQTGNLQASGWDLVTHKEWADADHQRTMLSPDLCEIGAGVSLGGALAYYVIDAACPSGSSGTGGTTPVPGATSSGSGGGATQVTVIPNTPKPDGSITHIVRPGETLWSIAVTYKTTIAQLKALNNLADETIYPSDTLIVARAVNTPTPTATATGTPVPTATPFVFRTATRPALTATPVPATPVTGGSGMIVVGVIVVAALVAAGAMTAVGARKRPRD